jgi:putative DNA-invertase from lambdoid prophage Rac
MTDPRDNTMARIAYFRVSTRDQSIESQRHTLGGNFDEEFSDNGVSGTVAAMERPGFKACAAYLRKGDTLCVYAVVEQHMRDITTRATIANFLFDASLYAGSAERLRAAAGLGHATH